MKNLADGKSFNTLGAVLIRYCMPLSCVILPTYNMISLSVVGIILYNVIAGILIWNGSRVKKVKKRKK